MGGDEGPDRQDVGTLVLLPGLRHRLVALLGIAGGLLPVTGQALDAGQLGGDVATPSARRRARARSGGVSRVRLASSSSSPAHSSSIPWIQPGRPRIGRHPTRFRGQSARSIVENAIPRPRTVSWKAMSASALGEHAGLTELLRHLERVRAHELRRSATLPGSCSTQARPRSISICSRRSSPDLGERRLEELRADVEALLKARTQREQGERAGTIASARRCGDDLLEQRARPLGLARLEVALGGLDPSSARLGGELAGGEPASLFPQRRRRIRGAAGPRPAGRASSSSAATAASGASAASARCPARSSGSSRTAARRACSLRRSAAVAFA